MLGFIIRTFKQDCPVHVTLRASGDGSALEVKSVCNEHSHAVSQVC